MLQTKNFFILFFVCITSFQCIPLSGEIILLSPAEKSSVSTIHPLIKKFWSLDGEERLKILKNEKSRLALEKEHEAKFLTFFWECTDGEKPPFEVEFFCEDKATPCPHVLVADGKTELLQASASNFELGRTYFWRVKGRDKNGNETVSKTGSFTSSPDCVRLFANAEGMKNMRDIGGRKGLNGKKIRQGMIYRSAGLNDNSPDYNRNVTPTQEELKKMRKGAVRLTKRGREYMERNLGIKTDLDLRRPGETAGMTASPIGESVQWINVTFYSYNGLFSENGKKAVKECFRVFSDGKNYPVVFHCIAGVDRTGSLAVILGGILGENQEDILKDFELSAHENAAIDDLRASLITGFDKFAPPGASFTEKIEGYLLSCGITEEEINAFRAIMLE